MKLLISKFLILGAPFVVAVAIELFIFPVDFFTFRVWESVIIGGPARPAVGPFYPNLHIVKAAEHGDMLGFRDPKTKHVEWFTDRFGFRNRPRDTEPLRYDIVVVGSSNIVGSYYDQKDTIAEVLARKCRCEVYSYSVSSISRFFSDPRFKSAPPRAIVVETMAGHFYDKSAIEFFFFMPVDEATELPVDLAVLIDRLWKENMLQFLRSRLGVQLKQQSRDSPLPGTRLEDREANEFAEKIVAQTRDEARRRGMEMVWLLQPHADGRIVVPAVAELSKSDIKMIAFLPKPRLPDGVNLAEYWSERDTHWRGETVLYTADAILTKLNWTNYAPELRPAPYLQPPVQ